MPNIPYQNLGRLAALVPSQFRRTAAALAQVGEEVASQWRRWALGDALPGGDRIVSRSGAYAQSIQSRPVPVTGGLGVEVFTDSKIHDWLDRGTQAYDMKAMLSRSLRVKRAAAGHRYMSIPFRHDVQKSGEAGPTGPRGEMRVPRAIQHFFHAKERSGLGSTSVLERVWQRSQQDTGHANTWISRARTQWGVRLRGKPIGVDPMTKQPLFEGQRTKLTTKGPYQWKAGIREGMVHSQGFQGRHGSYMTFRTVSEKSPASSWIHPGIKPKRIMDAVRQHLASMNIEERMAQAAREDILAILDGE